jgi:hypothetical protein
MIYKLKDGTRVLLPLPPPPQELLEGMEEGGCETPDGCWVEPDGTCQHGYPSWLIILGMI